MRWHTLGSSARHKEGLPVKIISNGQTEGSPKPIQEQIDRVPPELTLRDMSYGVVVLLGITLFALSLISIRKENRQGQPLNGIIRFAVAIIGSCAAIALLAGYVQKARSLEEVTHGVEPVAFGVE
jgi:hypothetical protein